MSSTVIWKYEWPFSGLAGPTERAEFDIPVNTKILTVQMQHGLPVIWAVVNPEYKKEKRTFRMVGTGQPVPKQVSIHQYIGTVQMHSGDLILHVFEEFPAP